MKPHNDGVNQPKAPRLNDQPLDLDNLSDDQVTALTGNGIGSQITSFGETMQKLVQGVSMAPHLAESLKKFSTFNVADLLPPIPDYSERFANIDLTIPPNPAYETNRLLNELLSKIEEQGQQNAKLIAPNYDPNSGHIIFGNKLIKIPKNTNQSNLCGSLFSKPGKEWSWDEMLEDWGEFDAVKEDWRKVYEAARSVNQKVAIKTGVEDLLIYTKTSVTLNSAYVGPRS